MPQTPTGPPAIQHPKIEWKDGEFIVTLPMPDKGEIRAKWKPVATSVIRVREVGTDRWSFGFETPLNSCNIIGLDPDREYEAEVRYKTADGEGPPRRMRVPHVTTDFTQLPRMPV